MFLLLFDIELYSIYTWTVTAIWWQLKSLIDYIESTLLNCKIKNNHLKLTILRISFLALSDIWVNRFSYISSISLISVDLLLSNSEDFWKYIHKSIRKWFLKYIINMNLIFILIDYSNYGIERFRCEVPLDSIPFTDSSIKISAGNKLNWIVILFHN